jgi:chaperone required for assembly of F1-ATPase
VKRFWEAAKAAPTEGGFAILLDGRPMRLPGGGALRVAEPALAAAIAEEWQAAGGAKGGTMRPDEVPLTRLAGTAAERIAPDPAGTITALARYGETDLLCYRAEDRRLAARQAAGWDPWLRWAAQDLDAPLMVTTGIMPVAQPASALAALRAAVARHAALHLAALGVAVPALGSLVLGLALAQGRLAPAEALRLSVLEEDFQAEFWGADADATARRDSAVADVALAGRLFALLRG